MAYLKFNESIVNGDTSTVRSWTFKDSDGNPVDISAWVIFYTVKADYADADADAAANYESTNDPSQVTKSDSGTGTTDTVSVSLTQADSQALVVGTTYYQDVQRVISGTDVWTFALGVLTPVSGVTADVTA